MYVILEYVALIALALFLGAFAFGISVIALLGQEGGKRLVVGSRTLRQHATRLIEQSRPSADGILLEETHQSGQ